MPEKVLRFPAGFMWGTATASHQVEGSNTNNNWYAWENTPGKIKGGHKSGLACDWWGGRWQEDLDRAAAGGQNAHRFSVEWSRVQPACDRWDEAALDAYRQMAQGMVDRGLTPMVTLHHFSDPLWLMAQGGWENDTTPEKFAAFAIKVVTALKDLVHLWITTNEPNGYVANGYVFGVFPPGKHDQIAAYKVMRNLVRGHAAAYHAIHQIQPEARVGVAHSYRPLRVARPWFPLDWWARSFVDLNYNQAFAHAVAGGKLKFLSRVEKIPAAAHSQDFLGLNYYSVDEIMFTLKPAQLFLDRRFPHGSEVSETGFVANIPGGLYDSVRWAHQFGLPILITENGVEGNGDDLRQRYILEHIYQAWRAVDHRFQVEGFFYWTLVDNFEWERGWTQCFGLWGLTPETQERHWRPSVDLYSAICRENGISQNTLQRFAPELEHKLLK